MPRLGKRALLLKQAREELAAKRSKRTTERPVVTDSAVDEDERPTTSGLCPGGPSAPDNSEDPTASSSTDSDFNPEEALNSDWMGRVLR